MTGAAGQVSRPETVIEASGLASGYGGRGAGGDQAITRGGRGFVSGVGRAGGGQTTPRRRLLALLPREKQWTSPKENTERN